MANKLDDLAGTPFFKNHHLGGLQPYSWVVPPILGRLGGLQTQVLRFLVFFGLYRWIYDMSVTNSSFSRKSSCATKICVANEVWLVDKLLDKHQWMVR